MIQNRNASKTGRKHAASASDKSGRGPLRVVPGKDYKGGYHDADLAALAAEDGQAAVQNPSVFGENTHPHLIESVNAAHDTAASLVAHRLRSDVQATDDELDRALPQIAAQTEVALGAIDDYADKGIAKAELELEARSEGVGLPHHLAHMWLAGCIGILVYGDLPVVAKSFEQFHLSDRPLVPGVHLTDELHLAGLASIAALIILSHLAGHNLRLVAHAVNRRRLVAKEERYKLPAPSYFAAVTSAVSVCAAVVLLNGLSVLRVDYLLSQGETSNQGAFFAINLGVLAAAIGAAFLFANPFGRQLADAARLLKASEKRMDDSIAGLAGLVGDYNAGVHRRQALLAEAGHHVGASESDAVRQAHLVARQTILSQPEATTERLFPETLPQPTRREDDALAQFLVGCTALPTFESVDITVVTERRAAVRELVNAIRLTGEQDNTDDDAANGSAPVDDTGSSRAQTPAPADAPVALAPGVISLREPTSPTAAHAGGRP